MLLKTSQPGTVGGLLTPEPVPQNRSGCCCRTGMCLLLLCDMPAYRVLVQTHTHLHCCSARLQTAADPHERLPATSGSLTHTDWAMSHADTQQIICQQIRKDQQQNSRVREDYFCFTVNVLLPLKHPQFARTSEPSTNRTCRRTLWCRDSRKWEFLFFVSVLILFVDRCARLVSSLDVPAERRLLLESLGPFVLTSLLLLLYFTFYFVSRSTWTAENNLSDGVTELTVPLMSADHSRKCYLNVSKQNFVQFLNLKKNTE